MEELIKDNQNITLTEDEVLEQSRNAVRTIADNLLKTKAYYNALAANAVMKYLEDKGLLPSGIVNMHSSSKILTDFEVADIQLPNLHIDVRAVFDENLIFIPKKHFDFKILPDIYLVVKFDDDLLNGTLLGFVEPSKINKQNQNEEYYFVNKSALTSPAKLVEIIKSRPVKQQYMISESGDSAIEKLIMLFMDHDLDDLRLEKLLDYLKNSAVAREKLVEFETFERLSYMALQEFKDLDVENNDFTKYIKTLVATDEFAQFDGKDDLEELFGDTPRTIGLFMDEDLEEPETVQDEPVVEEPVIDEEELPLTKAVHDEEIADNLDESESEKVEIEEDSFDSLTDETLEETPVELEESLETDAFEDVAVEPEESLGEEENETFVGVEITSENLPEVEETPVTDEFEAFEETDEFDLPDGLSEEFGHDIESEQEVQAEAEPTFVEEKSVEISADEPVVDFAPTFEDPEIEELSVAEPVVDDLDTLELPETIDSDVIEPEAIEPAEIETEELITAEEEPEVEPIMPEEVAQAPSEVESEDSEAITEQDIANASENLVESLTGEDLELHMEGLESIDETFDAGEELELSGEELGEISLETPELAEDEIVAEPEEKKEESAELEVAKALELDEVPLDGETVIGLTEGVLDVENIEDFAASDDVSTSAENISFEELDNLNFDVVSEEDEAPSQTPEKPEVQETEPETALADFVESVSDEEIEKAIAQTQEAEQLQEKNRDIDLDDITSFISETSSSDDEMSLEELLSIEDDLSGNSETNDVRFSMPEDEAGNEVVQKDAVAASAEALASEGDSNPVAEESATPEAKGVEDGKESDFAFAVDAKPEGGRKNLLIPVAALVTVLGLAGAGGAWYFLTQKPSGTSIDIDNLGSGSADTGLDITDVVPSTTETSSKTDENLQKPDSSGSVADVKIPAAPDNESSKPEAITLQKIKKDFSQPNTYLSVSSIVWDVPEYLIYNDDFNGYLQTLGSTLKLNLSSDLLLINENTVLDRVKVRIQLKDSGKKYSAEITEGCGTQTVDDLVLQSVKSTLNLLQPPVNSLDTADEDLYLTIRL